MTNPQEGVFAILGLKLVNVLVGAVMSFCALRFFDGLSVFEKWTTFVGGWALAAWGAPPTAVYLKLDPKVEIGLVILLALFGMATAAALIKMLKDSSIANMISRRFGGGS